MNKLLSIIFAAWILAVGARGALAGDDGHGSMKESGNEMINLTADTDAVQGAMFDVMAAYIKENSDDDGILHLEDPGAGKTRNLDYISLHDKIRMKNGKHYACADFKDVETGETVDADVFLDVSKESISGSGIVFHKVVGAETEGSSAADETDGN